MLRIAKVRDVKTPERGTEQSAGVDFFIPNDFEATVVAPEGKILIPSGVHIDLVGSGLENMALVFFNKSGIASKLGFLVGACVVDADYQGEVHINLINASDKAIRLEPGQKIIQGLLLQVAYEDVVELAIEDLYQVESERGAGGFGSTGG